MAKHKLLVAAGYLLVLCTLIITLTHYYYAFSVGFFTATNFLDDPPKYHGEIKSTMGPYGGSFDGGVFFIYNQEPLYILSLIAGIIVIVLFLKEWKMTWRGFKNA